MSTPTRLLNLLQGDYASWVDPGDWKPWRLTDFRPLVEVISHRMRREFWFTFAMSTSDGPAASLDEQVTAGEDCSSEVDLAGERAPDQQGGQELNEDVAQSRPSADDAESGLASYASEQPADQIPCPNADKGCDYAGSQKGINAHLRFCEYREQP